MWALILASAVALAAPPATRTPSTLFMPIEAVGEVGRDLAVALTDALAAHAGKVVRQRVLSFREVESAMSAEQMRQASNCDSASCAAEIAGALNVEEIVIGSLSKFGTRLQVVLSRVDAKKGAAVARFSGSFPSDKPEELFNGVPAMILELFGADVVTTEERPSPVLPWALRGGAIGALALSPLALILAGVCAATVLTVFVLNDFQPTGSRKIFAWQGLGSDVALGLMPLFGLVFVALGAAGIGLLVTSFVVPG